MKVLTKIFIIIELLLYVTFNILDFNNYFEVSNIIKYTSIILCFLYSLINKKYLISLGLLFTLISDYFLLNNIYINIGLITFIIVQLIYMFNNKKKNYLLRIILIVITELILLILKINNITYYLCVIYFLNLLINMFSSINDNNKLFTLGLILFIGCDISVGLYNLDVLTNITRYSMWIFYLPSQVLISLSNNNFKLISNKKQ